MGKSFFEKRPVFSIRKLSVGACSVVIGISALGLSRAVSYTHLDVYKRQAKGIAVLEIPVLVAPFEPAHALF